MLELLHIENIAVIEQADIAFRPGFNALTGETGAGKSIVIDAMGAVLGGRTSRDLIRTGADKAFVSATFSGVREDLPGLLANGVKPDEDGNLLLQRELNTEGKNLCRANGRPVTVAQLREIGRELLNIHGQHDGQQLLDEEQHGAYLDRFGRLESQRESYAACYHAMSDLRGQIRRLQMDEAEKARRVDTLKFQIDELERAKLKPGEEEELVRRRDILRHGEKFLSAVDGADFFLSGDDEQVGAVTLLRQAEESLSGVKRLDDSLEELVKRLENARCEVYDLAELIRDKREEFDFSPAELDELESRSDLLYRLKKKYGATVEEMLEYLDRCRRELDAIETADDTIAHLEGQLREAEKKTKAAGAALTKARTEAARRLEEHILRELQDLDMGRVRFSIELTEKEPAEDGCDSVRFLLSANAGEDLRPLARIASGGELARIMLALKNVLAEQDQVGTLVFDEVDTGVSGRAAQRIAEKMAQVSRHKQVLCVTHLPQLAAMADTHFSVEKGERGGRTYTRVLCLDRQQRAQELARLTGGAHVTEALLRSAEELLDEAEAYRKKLS
ncbi:MAG: DNA repair protein RecN [Oscillospiraceae bacterium]|nr:DNA repair protein RecN [Oscillospiraceae bacterium]